MLQKAHEHHCNSAWGLWILEGKCPSIRSVFRVWVCEWRAAGVRVSLNCQVQLRCTCSTIGSTPPWLTCTFRWPQWRVIYWLVLFCFIVFTSLFLYFFWLLNYSLLIFLFILFFLCVHPTPGQCGVCRSRGRISVAGRAYQHAHVRSHLLLLFFCSSFLHAWCWEDRPGEGRIMALEGWRSQINQSRLHL